MFNWNKKEAPLKALAGLGGGVGRSGAGGQGSATGGTKIVNNNKTYHVFYTVGSHTFSVSNGNISDLSILLIGGGGSGSDGYGSGGGGAGSVVHATGTTVTIGPHPVVIGGGGSGVTGPSHTTCRGNPGNNTTASLGSQPYIANGGGGGGSGHSSSPQPQVFGRPGGSGGGGGYYGQPGSLYPNQGGTGTAPPTSPSGQATTASGGKSYQYPGGAGDYGVRSQCGGGGGGSGQRGRYHGDPNSTFGLGGDAASFPEFPAPVIAPGIPQNGFPGEACPSQAGSPYGSPTATNVRAAFVAVVGPTGLYGGGGGAGHQGGPWLGGSGGGGTGSPAGGNGKTGVHGTGSGGGVASGGGQGGTSGAGGSGLVVIAYPS